MPVEVTLVYSLFKYWSNDAYRRFKIFKIPLTLPYAGFYDSYRKLEFLDVRLDLNPCWLCQIHRKWLAYLDSPTHPPLFFFSVNVTPLTSLRAHHSTLFLIFHIFAHFKRNIDKMVKFDDVSKKADDLFKKVFSIFIFEIFLKFNFQAIQCWQD